MQPGGAVQTEGTQYWVGMQQNRVTICASEKCVWLNQTPRPGHHCQRDFILLQLEHWDEGGVVHSHCCGSVHCHYLIAAPAESHRSVSTEPPACEWWQTSAEWSFDLLEASIKMSRCTRHDGFDEERLLAVALLVATHNTEAPALIIGLLQHDVPAPMHMTETTNTFYT